MENKKCNKAENKPSKKESTGNISENLNNGITEETPLKKSPADVAIVNPEEINDYYDFVDFPLEGTSYKTTLNNKFTARKKYELPNPKLVRAFIPGTIQKIFVTDGATVKKNDKLLVLEAMKMKNVLLAPLNGNIKKVYVKQGTLVAKNEILIEMD